MARHSVEEVSRVDARAWTQWCKQFAAQGSTRGGIPFSEIPKAVERARSTFPRRAHNRPSDGLFKYGLVKKACIRPGALQSALPRMVNGVALSMDGRPIREAAFVTPDEYLSGSVAANLLGVGYQPRFRMTRGIRHGPWQRWHDSDFCPGCSEEYVNVFGEAGLLNRVWPAFGRPGGGLETLLVDGAWQCVRASQIPEWSEGAEMQGVQYEDWRPGSPIVTALQGGVPSEPITRSLEWLRSIGDRSVASKLRAAVKVDAQTGGAVGALDWSGGGMTVSIFGGFPAYVRHSSIWLDVQPLRFYVTSSSRIELKGVQIETPTGQDELRKTVTEAFDELQAIGRQPWLKEWLVSPLGPSVQGESWSSWWF